jgi:hypothetical protein
MEAKTMTDNKVETLIWRALQKKCITFNDMIGVSNYVDDFDNKTLTDLTDIRRNRFKEYCGSGRMKEILCRGENNPCQDYPPFKVSLQDLFSFWWNRCIDRNAFIDEILEDIYQYFTEQMRPPEKEPETMDMTLDFAEVIQSPVTDLNEARIKRKGHG